MTFDSRHNQAIITGQSVSGSDSKCFLSYFNMTTGLLSKPLRQRTRACSSIAYSPLEDTVYLGSTDKPTNFAATGNPNMVLLGLLMKIDLIADGAESPALNPSTCAGAERAQGAAPRSPAASRVATSRTPTLSGRLG